MKTKNFFYALSVAVCLLGVSINEAWACSNSKDKAQLTAVCLDSESGKGRVYTSTSATPPTNVGNYAANNASGSKQQEDEITDFPLYAHAKAVRGYEFDHWEDATESNWVDYRTLPEDMTTNPICVLMNGNEGCSGVDPSIAVVNAFFHEITPFSIQYKAGQYVYKIDYTYVAITENDVLENKVWESYTILNTSSTQTLKTYVGDKVSLSTSITDGFAGWFIEGQDNAVSTANPYTFNPTEADAGKVFYPQWNAPTGNVASVNGTEYATIQEAVSVANTSIEANVTLSLLQNVLYNESDYLDLGRDMTIDLNGKIFYGMKGSTFRITNGATVTIKDDASTKGKVWGLAANQGESQAIDVLQGTLINNGAVITMDNMLGETDYTANTLSSVVRVHTGGIYTQTSGTLNSNSISNAYGVYSEGTTNINGGNINSTVSLTNACAIFSTDGTTNVTTGTIKVQAKYKACGVYADGNAGGTAADVIIAGGTFNVTATSRDAVGVRTADGTTTINGGTFNVTYSAAIYNAYGVVAGLPSVKDREGYPNNGKLIVNNGTFNIGTASKTYYSYGIYIEPSIANASYGDPGYIATTINGGKFKMLGTTVGGAVNEIAESLQIKGGFYSSNTRLDLNIPTSHHSEALSSGTEYDAGYRYQVVSGAPETTEAVCKIGETTFNTLEDAISYANNNPDETLTILMLKDYVLSQSGKYTIPAKTTLLIPKDANQTTPTRDITRENNNAATYIPQKAYITVTLCKDVMLDVKGAIEVGGQQNCYNNVGSGRPNGPSYGWLLMKTGSHILLEGSANLYAWGFVTGNGTIDVRRGATVHEQFQIYDFEGGSESFYELDENPYDVFLINEYFIQNVEVPTTYRPGSSLYGYTGLYNKPINSKLIGVETDDAALFMMDEADESEDTWVRKSYNVSTDQQVYELNNSAKLSNMIIEFNGYTFNSKQYVLPITNNMKIHLLDGEMGVMQSVVLLPGAEIEIDKKSTAYIVPEKSLFLFDYHEWDAHIHQNAYARRIECRPGALPTASIRDISSSVGLGNAKMNIHGTFDARGALYTTESGATIISTNEDAGNVTFSTAAPSGSETPLYVHKYPGMFYQRPTVPALLQNTDGTYEQSASTPAGKSFCYMNDKWTMLTIDSDSSCFVYDQYDQYYAQAGEYVAINATKNPSTKKITGNPDHTYSDAAGAGRLFILVEGCQWWEVENVENLYHCIHPQNDTYYYWDDKKGWLEKKFAISWKNWDGSDLRDGNNKIIKPDSLSYGVTPQYLHTPNPVREADIDYTYTFDDWNPTLSPVTKDQTYTATYIKEDRKYVIIFKDAENVEVKREFLNHNAMPTPPVLTNDDKILQWTPAISAVTGPATYTATWLDVEPTEYAITFYDYDGTTKLKPTGDDPYMVAVEATPDAPAIVNGIPTGSTGKPATNEFTYVFDHWSPAIEAVSHTSPKSFTAVYREVDKMYAIRFFDEGMTNADKTDENALSKQDLAYGVTPTPPSVSKSATGHTYIPEWVDMSSLTFDGEGNITTNEKDWVKSVSTVTKPADYVVVYRDEINRYTVTATSSINAGCVILGAGTFDYGTEVTLTVTPNPGYRFLYWSDDNTNTDNPRSFTLEDNVSLTAVVEQYIQDLDLSGGSTATYSKPNTPIRNLIISSDGNNSSYLNGAENLVLSEVDGVQGQAYFDLTLNTYSRHWNAFAVPFEVDLKNTSIVEVKTIAGAETNRTLRYGRDYDIIYYKESERATNGPSYNCWDYIDSKNKVMTPGEAYLIAFTSHVGTIRFTGEQDSEHHIKLGTGVEVTYTTPADPKDGGWNGIGNPKTYHALLNAGVTECQIHNGDTIGSDSYIAYEMTNKKFVVGKAAFVKVGAAPSVVVERATNQSAITLKAAPRRANSIVTGSDRYTVEIMPENGKLADRLFLLIDEDKTDEYTDGKDLPKAGIGSTRAQMWVSRYSAKLCKNTIAFVDDQAVYPLGIFAPKAGEYMIYVAAKPEEEQELYLTLDGEAIWNLSDGAYTLNLERGTTNQYGLRVSAKTPQIATGIDEAVVDAHGKTEKVLINNQVYIIRGGKVYTVDGQLVK